NDIARLERDLLPDVLACRAERGHLVLRYSRSYGVLPPDAFSTSAEQRLAVTIGTALGLSYDAALWKVRQAPVRYDRNGEPEALDLRPMGDVDAERTGGQGALHPAGVRHVLWCREPAEPGARGRGKWERCASGTGAECLAELRRLAEKDG